MNETKLRFPQTRLEKRTKSSEPEAGTKVASAEFIPGKGIFINGDVFMTLDQVRENFGETNPQVVADIITKVMQHQANLDRQAYLTTPRRD